LCLRGGHFVEVLIEHANTLELVGLANLRELFLSPFIFRTLRR
jgi:hypothetical protein